jgi:hypothetical protein
VDAEIRIDEEHAERQILDDVIEITAAGGKARAGRDLEGAAEMLCGLAEGRGGVLANLGLVGGIADFDGELARTLAEDDDASRGIVVALLAEPVRPKLGLADFLAGHELVVVEDLVGRERRLAVEVRVQCGEGVDVGGDRGGLQSALRKHDVAAADEIVAGDKNKTAWKRSAQDVEDAVPVGAPERHVIDATGQAVLRIPHRLYSHCGAATSGSEPEIAWFPRAGPREAVRRCMGGAALRFCTSRRAFPLLSGGALSAFRLTGCTVVSPCVAPLAMHIPSHGYRRCRWNVWGFQGVGIASTAVGTMSQVRKHQPSC